MLWRCPYSRLLMSGHEQADSGDPQDALRPPSHPGTVQSAHIVRLTMFVPAVANGQQIVKED